MGNSARMTRGFRRIGIVLAAPLLAVAFLIVGFGATVEVIRCFERVPLPIGASNAATSGSEGVKDYKADPGLAGKLAESPSDWGAVPAQGSSSGAPASAASGPAAWGAVPAAEPKKPYESPSKSSVDQVNDLIQAALDGRLPDPQPVETVSKGPEWTTLLLLSSGLAVAAALIYLTFWSVGWIFAGFADD